MNYLKHNQMLNRISNTNDLPVIDGTTFSSVALSKRKPGRIYAHTHPRADGAMLGPIIKELTARRRKPGILDQISTCESYTTACNLWESFIHTSNPSSKTINKAHRLLLTLDFPLP